MSPSPSRLIEQISEQGEEANIDQGGYMEADNVRLIFIAQPMAPPSFTINTEELVEMLEDMTVGGNEVEVVEGKFHAQLVEESCGEEIYLSDVWVSYLLFLLLPLPTGRNGKSYINRLSQFISRGGRSPTPF